MKKVDEMGGAEGSREEVQLTYTTRFAIRILALLAVCATLYFARSFFVPIVVALVLALMFSPMIQWGKKIMIPSAVSAALVIALFGGIVAGGVTTLATPFAELVSNAPQIGAKLKRKLSTLRSPVASINKVGEQVDKLTQDATGIRPTEVIVKQPGLFTRAADDVAAIVGTIILTLVLSYFLLVSRDMFFTKLVKVLPTLSDKKRALTMIKDIENDVSSYLLTVSVINFGLGCAVGFALWSLGMPNPLLWGVLAALLNFLPYIGALLGIIMVAGVAIITFDSVGVAMLAPGVYILLTIVEGQFITPLLLGRRFSLNTVVILVSIAFWGFMWGPVGVVIAVPLLIILKVFCDRVEPLKGFGEFLSGQPESESDEVLETAITG